MNWEGRLANWLENFSVGATLITIFEAFEFFREGVAWMVVLGITTAMISFGCAIILDSLLLENERLKQE